MTKTKSFRKATAFFLAFVFVFSVALPAEIAKAESKATIYTGGDIVTVSDKNQTAEAIVVKDGKIVQVGSLAEAKKTAGENADTVDLKGHTLIPGFYDSHSHFLATGNASLTSANLSSPPMGNVSSFQDLTASLTAWEKKTPADQWILGKGYDDGQLKENRHPTADDLDKVSTDRPVVITHFSGHNIVVNHKALELAGITKDSKDPEGGEIGRDSKGEPNGQLWEKAVYLVYQKQPPFTKDQQLASLKMASEIYAKAGMTSVNEGAGSNEAFDLYMTAIEKDLIKQHVNYWFTDWNKASELYKKYLKGNESVHYAGKDDLMQLTGIKMFQDGSPQLRTAYMTDPYYTLGEYPEGWKAYPRVSREKLIENVVRAHQAGINNIYIHGNGDAAIDDVLAAYEAVWKGVKDGSLRQPENIDLMRHVVIHTQFSREDQFQKMKDIHALPSFLIMHPYFLGDRHWDIYFGPERSARMSATRDAANYGLRFALHCDAPVFPVDNMLMLQTAVERKSFTGRDIFTTEYKKDDKYRSVDQRITPYEALKALTLDAAYHNGEENIAGSIDVGKRANLVILDKIP